MAAITSMTPRRTIPASIKAAVAERQAGICDCGLVLLGTAELDHIVPLALGGDNDAANLRWRHRHCHKAKTARDIKMISKADRIRKRLEGKQRAFKKRIKSRGFDKRYRKRMDGTVEARR